MPFSSLLTLNFDLWPSNSSEQWTKHDFRVNLAQIRSAVPEIFHTQTKNRLTAPKNRIFRSSVRAVITTTRGLLCFINRPLFCVFISTQHRLHGTRFIQLSQEFLRQMSSGHFVTSTECRWSRRRRRSKARRRYVPVCWTPSCIGFMFPSDCTTVSVQRFTGVCRSRLQSTWWNAAFRSLTLPVGSTYCLPVATGCLYRVTGVRCSVVEPSL